MLIILFDIALALLLWFLVACVAAILAGRAMRALGERGWR
jgi:uncharacterized protein involved in cysteine biosynthesis